MPYSNFMRYERQPKQGELIWLFWNDMGEVKTHNGGHEWTTFGTIAGHMPCDQTSEITNNFTKSDTSRNLCPVCAQTKTACPNNRLGIEWHCYSGGKSLRPFSITIFLSSDSVNGYNLRNATISDGCIIGQSDPTTTLSIPNFLNTSTTRSFFFKR